MNIHPLTAVPLPPPPPELPAALIYQPAGSNDRPDLQLLRSTENAIALHLANHISLRRLAKEPPRNLGIVGPMGEGKTRHAQIVPSRLGVDLYAIPGAALAGEVEGAPIALLQAIEAVIKHQSETTERQAALFIDDIDASALAERPDQHRTVNSNLLAGYFQAVASDLSRLTTADGRPIAVIWTANDTSHFRAPLIREQRCLIHHHVLDWSTKQNIIENLLKPTTAADRQALRDLADAYRYHSIAFWRDVATQRSASAVLAAIAEYGLDPEMIDAADAGGEAFDIAAIRGTLKARAATRGGNFFSKEAPGDR